MSAKLALREGLLLGSTFGVMSAFSSSSPGEAGDGRESLESLASRTIASTFSWELRGSTTSLLGTGVVLVGRFAKDSELLFVVVSFRHDDFLFSLMVDGVLSELGVAPLAFGLGWVAALEKNPKMLCCFPVDEGVLAATVDFSPILVGFGSINRSDGHQTNKRQRQQEGQAPINTVLYANRRRRGVVWNLES